MCLLKKISTLPTGRDVFLKKTDKQPEHKTTNSTKKAAKIPVQLKKNLSIYDWQNLWAAIFGP